MGHINTLHPDFIIGTKEYIWKEEEEFNCETEREDSLMEESNSNINIHENQEQKQDELNRKKVI